MLSGIALCTTGDVGNSHDGVWVTLLPLLLLNGLYELLGFGPLASDFWLFRIGSLLEPINFGPLVR
jgi:hypothetical protein